MKTNRYADLLAWIGEGSAHPGGFATTLEMVRNVKIPSGAKVLEIGCGTGRTACYLREKWNCSIIGLDIHPVMISKAKSRAENMGLDVQFVCGDGNTLPFESDSFDLVLAESVLIFNPGVRMLAEIHRVLKPGGQWMNVELYKFKKAKIPQQEVFDIYGTDGFPTMAEWRRWHVEAGFKKIKVKQKPLKMRKMQESGYRFPDEYQQVTENFQQNPEVESIWLKNIGFFQAYESLLGYTLIKAVK